MNKGKGVFWLIILGFISLLIFQNQDFFLKEASIGVNLYFYHYQTPELPSALFFISFFVLGLLIAYFFSLFPKFKSNQTIKDLNNKLKGQNDVMAKMGEELAALKAVAEEKNVLNSEPVQPKQEQEETAGAGLTSSPGEE